MLQETNNIFFRPYPWFRMCIHKFTHLYNPIFENAVPIFQNLRGEAREQINICKKNFQHFSTHSCLEMLLNIDFWNYCNFESNCGIQYLKGNCGFCFDQNLSETCSVYNNITNLVLAATGMNWFKNKAGLYLISAHFSKGSSIFE